VRTCSKQSRPRLVKLGCHFPYPCDHLGAARVLHKHLPETVGGPLLALLVLGTTSLLLGGLSLEGRRN
jgi:hypothetical protein